MIRITIEGNDWSEIRLQLADTLETLRRVPEAPRTETPQLASVPDEPPWPVETIPEAAQRVFPDAKPAPSAASAPRCASHGDMVRWPAGTSQKSGKPFNASWRCDVRDCTTKPIWDSA